MGALSSKCSSIEDDYRSLNSLLAAAKFGRWAEVWAIIGSPDRPLKAYLLNSIPAERRWSVLHQAVYWRDRAVIETLLKFDACDIGVKAKEGTCEVGPAGGKTPRDVAEQFKYKEIVNLLEGHSCKVWSQEMPTFHSQKFIAHNDGLGLWHITLAAYKDAFHPSMKPSSKTVLELMKDIFTHVNTGNNWKTVRDKVSQPLYPVCPSATSTLDLCETRKDFFEKIINVYSCESSQLYTYVNTALRRQKRHNYMPTADDLAIGPYILMFNMLLQYWEAVREKETITTFRRMLLTADDSLQYQPETVFVWISIVSSSLLKTKAMPFPTCGPTGDVNVLFVIDNSTDSPWRPRNIENFAEFDERERVYPAGARFRVVSRGIEEGITTIRIKLLGEVTGGEKVAYINPDCDVEIDIDYFSDDEEFEIVNP